MDFDYFYILLNVILNVAFRCLTDQWTSECSLRIFIEFPDCQIYEYEKQKKTINLIITSKKSDAAVFWIDKINELKF